MKEVAAQGRPFKVATLGEGVDECGKDFRRNNSAFALWRAGHLGSTGPAVWPQTACRTGVMGVPFRLGGRSKEMVNKSLTAHTLPAASPARFRGPIARCWG